MGVRLKLDSNPKRALAEVMGRRWRHRNTLEPVKPLSPDAVRQAARKAGLDERETNELVKGARMLVRRASAKLERSENIRRQVDELGEDEGEDGRRLLDDPDRARRLALGHGWSDGEANLLAKRAKQNRRRNEALAAPGSAARRKSDEFWSIAS